MDRDRPGGESTYGETATLVREFDALKRHGCSLLLVGAEGGVTDSVTCTRFMGDSSAGSRRRLFVVTDADTDDRVAEIDIHGTQERIHVIRFESVERSAAATASAGEGIPIHREASISDRSLHGLGVEISETIDTFDAASDGGLDPAEFRLCFDSLTPLIEEHEDERLFRFLHLLTHRVKSVNGMAHFHLPVGRQHPVIGLLEPLFDALVEFSVRDGTVQQRWTMRDGDLQTDWLNL